MAFYTPTWVRRLVKEDHKAVQEFLKDSKNDFRDYIDSVTPFVLWLDIGLIRERILGKNKTWIQELASVVSNERDVTQIVTNLIDKAYIETINHYIQNKAYKHVSQEKLEPMLSALSNAPLGQIRQTIKTTFARTFIVDEPSKLDRSVMIVFPNFANIRFGNVFKTALEKVVKADNALSNKSPEITLAANNPFAQLAVTGAQDSEKSRMLDFVNENFGKLQNLGHIEVDVISRQEKIVKRGQNSPRLLQALVSLPTADPKALEKLQVQFSKETGQATTRVKIRKRFTSSKLTFELLIEHGLAVGIPEAQQDNAYKAKLERAFRQGRGLTKQLRENPRYLTDLQTSKSIRQYLTETLKQSLSTGRGGSSYTSLADIQEKTRVEKTKVSVKNFKRTPSSAGPVSNKGKKPEVKPTQEPVNLTNLQNIINSMLQQQIRQNMGIGDSDNVLNYRTGRFAQSVEVKRITQGREGVITAYYDYMRYPYATFSQGGRQEFPRSRDPKLLISKSIREIMQQQAITRMRAVLI